MAKQPQDNRTGELIDLPKKRGRPATGTALSNAERKARYRAGKRAMTIDLDEPMYTELEARRAKYNADHADGQLSQSAYLQHVLRTTLFRKR